MNERRHKVEFSELNMLVNKMRERILRGQHQHPNDTHTIKLYGVPRGGVPVALALAGTGPFMLVDELGQADVVVDDLIDSGTTRMRYSDYPFYALINKQPTGTPYHNAWIEFPWEQGSTGGVEDNIIRILQFVGEDPSREGLLETPARVTKAWQSWCSGYAQDPAEVLKVFEDGASNYDEMVVVKDIPFYSKCEHHMADIFGTATIGYVPNGKIVGLSKLNRLLDVFARRLQVQERLTVQIADALMEHLDPKGAGVVIKARHMCMESRGVRQQGHHTITSALRGVFRDQPSTRSEFLSLGDFRLDAFGDLHHKGCMENNITPQIVARYHEEEKFYGHLGGTEVLRWTAYWVREDLGANSSQFADAMETLGVKRGTALNRWSDMKRNMEGLD